MKTVAEGEWNYNQAWLSTYDMDHVIVRVKADHDAHLVFSDTMGDENTNVYEVVLGSHTNTNSLMRRCVYCNNDVWVETPDILKPDEFRYFWFRWTNQMLQVGRGTVAGEGAFMDLDKEIHPTIVAVGLSTGWGSPGEWHLNALEGNVRFFSALSIEMLEPWR